MTDHKIIDQGDLRCYRIEIPNLIDDMNLSPFAFRLYVHFKRVAGANNESACYQSTKTLSKICNMSEGMVTKAKGELEKVNLINIECKKNEKGGKDYHFITIIDIWKKNFDTYSKKKNIPSSCDELAYGTNSPGELTSSCDEFTNSPGELKNKHIKNISNSSEDELRISSQKKVIDTEILKPQTDGGFYLFNTLGEIQRERSRRPPEKFQNSVQKKMFEEEEIRLGYSELVKAINHFISKGITSRGEIITRLKNWTLGSQAKNTSSNHSYINLDNKNYDKSKAAETMEEIMLEKKRSQEIIQTAMKKKIQENISS